MTDITEKDSAASPAGVPSALPFAALRMPGFRAFLGTFMLTMMADNIEHVISYWMLYEKFHSPTLAGIDATAWAMISAVGTPVLLLVALVRRA